MSANWRSSDRIEVVRPVGPSSGVIKTMFALPHVAYPFPVRERQQPAPSSRIGYLSERLRGGRQGARWALRTLAKPFPSKPPLRNGAYPDRMRLDIGEVLGCLAETGAVSTYGVGLWCGQSVRSSISSSASRAGWPNTSCGVNGAGWLAKPCLVPKHSKRIQSQGSQSAFAEVCEKIAAPP